MSSKKTPNLELHEWVPDDYVQMEEFNDNFKKLDTNAKVTSEKITTIEGEVSNLSQETTQKIDQVMSRLDEGEQELTNLGTTKIYRG